MNERFNWHRNRCQHSQMYGRCETLCSLFSEVCKNYTCTDQIEKCQGKRWVLDASNIGNKGRKFLYLYYLNTEFGWGNKIYNMIIMGKLFLPPSIIISWLLFHEISSRIFLPTLTVHFLMIFQIMLLVCG